jgi:hypothetical protein
MTFLHNAAPGSLDWFDGDAPGAPSGGFFGKQGWGNLVSINYSNLGATFTPAVQAVGGWFGQVVGNSPSKIEVRIYDRNSLLVGDNIVNLIPALHSPLWIGYKSDTLISRVEYRVNQFPDAGFFGGDNLTFGNVVPEPSTATLLLLGMLGCVGRRRR